MDGSSIQPGDLEVSLEFQPTRPHGARQTFSVRRACHAMLNFKWIVRRRD